MKKDRINTTSIREIKHSFKRFLSLLVMSMLGVGVFVGIKMASLDMMKSVDKYYDDTNLYDIKVISTLGLTNDDIYAIEKIDGIKKVYGSYSKDVIASTKDDELVLKVIGINDEVNKIEILEGRMPKNNDEVIIEKAMKNKESLNIGDYVTINDDTFKAKKLKIVGIVKSPLYIVSDTGSTNRGNTNIGTGKINYYVYVNNDNFDIDYFTEIYITVDGAKKYTTNSDEYNKKIDLVLSEINKIKSERQNERYSSIYNKANDEIQKNYDETESKLMQAKSKLDSYGTELAVGKKTLDDTNSKLLSAKEKLENTEKTLNDSKEKLNDFSAQLKDARNKLDESKLKLNSELEKYGLTLDDINNILYFVQNGSTKDLIISKIPSDTPGYEDIVNAINQIYDLGFEEDIKEFINEPNKKDYIISKIPEDTIGYEKIVEAINYIDDLNLKDYINNPDNIDSIIDKIPEDTIGYDKIVEALNNYKENQTKFNELINGIKEINKAEKEYDESLKLYNQLLSSYNEGYNTYIKYYNEYQNGLSEYNNGLNKYNSSLSLYNSKLKEYYDSRKMFNIKINEAKEKLSEIPECKWYMYTRLDDNGYSSFIDDGNSLSNLAKVFPTIFFVVAILISLISMSRMVEDDRGNIGTLKSLGFSNKHIRRKYILYSSIATLIGGIIGSIFGFYLLPKFIWNIYKILFDVPVFEYDYNPINIILGITIAVICICGTTLLTIRRVVKEKPSDLMRPKAPSNGKRVILERIPLIWNHINFSNKITARNLFRYKKRVFMTIGGILGCTALMLSGFGIRDSIMKIPDKQYKDIFNFDEMVYLTGNNNKEELDKIFDSNNITKRLDINMMVSAQASGYDVNIFVPYENDMKGIVNLKSLDTGERLNLEENKVIISDKLSELIDKKVKDKIILKDSSNKEYKFVISGICENYVSNYVFMDKNTYEKNIGEYNTNISFLKLDDLKVEESLSRKILENNNVMSIMSVNQTIKSVNNMLKSLNSVVAILIFLSGALSFVVLYNLSYINISERKREIATLKVLGFTDKEVDDYIVKETVILTIIGIVIGLIFGIFLTNVILDTVEIEVVRFVHHINISSYIITSFIVMLFTIIVSVIIHFTLKKIDMIESLKSVE